MACYGQVMQFPRRRCPAAPTKRIRYSNGFVSRDAFCDGHADAALQLTIRTMDSRKEELESLLGRSLPGATLVDVATPVGYPRRKAMLLQEGLETRG